MNKLKKTLCVYGDITVLKEGVVFTVFITGKDLYNWEKVNKIQKAVLEYAGDKYPKIEVLKNDDTYFLLILKP
jgi:hypothetical protein